MADSFGIPQLLDYLAHMGLHTEVNADRSPYQYSHYEEAPGMP
jgi:hypothetical protein